MRVENLDIASFIAEQMVECGPQQLKKNVMRDLGARRHAHCPEEGKLQKIA